MTSEEKMEIIADILEVDLEDVKEESVLEDYETWDSVAVLSVISVMNEEFNKFPHASEIREYKTVKDLMDNMK
ncbi:MAG: acyl carrier protein [Lachnospiraceae bacterium]|nr:acyl carrier protein [Lachnospiraceae bacterium]